MESREVPVLGAGFRQGAHGRGRLSLETVGTHLGDSDSTDYQESTIANGVFDAGCIGKRLQVTVSVL